MKLRSGMPVMVVAVGCISLVLKNSEAGSDSGYLWTNAIKTGVKTWPRWVHPIAAGDHELKMTRVVS